MSRLFVVIVALYVSAPALAAELPKSGNFDTPTGWKAVGEAMQVGGRTLGHGVYWGIVIGDNPLHIKAAMCPYISEQIGDTITANGRCAWSDADGDQIYAEFTGKLSARTGVYDGVQPMNGGTGKFRGIQGNIPHQCQFVGDTQATCTQHWTYQLP